MRTAFAALAWLVSALLAAGSGGAVALAAEAPARLVSRPGLALLIVPNDGKAAVPPEIASGTLTLRGVGRASAEALQGLAARGDLVRGVEARGDRLHLTLAPGTAAHAYAVPGYLVVDLRPGAAEPPTAKAGRRAEASARSRPDRRRPVPIPAPRPGTPASPPEPDAAAIQPEAAPVEPAAGPVAPRATVTAQASAEAAEIAFAWGRPVPAAVARRGDELWALFAAEPAEVAGWGELARPELARWLVPVGSEQAGGVRLFRLAVRQPAEIRVEQAADGWRLRLTPPRPELPGAAGRALVRGAEPGTLAATAPAGRLAVIPDPLTGDRLGVLLTTSSGLRQPTAQRLVDLELLPTAQGLLWRPLADDLLATLEGERFILSRPGGLRLSDRMALAAADRPTLPEASSGASPGQTAFAEPGREVARPAQADAEAAAKGEAGQTALVEAAPGAEPDRPMAAAPEGMAGGPPAASEAMPAAGPAAEPSPPPEPLIGLVALGETEAGDRQARRREIRARLGHLEGPERLSARLALARLLLADGLGPEAEAVLALDGSGEPASDALQRPRAALGAVAAALAGRPERALAGLLDPALDGDAEAGLWRLHAATRAGRWDRAQGAAPAAAAVLARYPLPLRRLLGPELAAAMIEQGEAGAALAMVEPLRRLEPEPGARARLDLLAARALLETGRPGEAARALAEAGGDGDRATRVEAAFLEARAGHEQGELSAVEARDRLLGLRSEWGDHREAGRMLRYLAKLQRETGDGLGAIASLDAASSRTTSEASAEALRAELRQQVAGLLQAEGEGGLPPLAAVALYRSHRELLASDALPVAARLGLARRAAEAGLTETAAALLAEAGPAPAEVAEAARLALAEAELGAGNGAAAVAHLREPAGKGDEGERHRLLRARAAFQAGDAKAALAALGEAAGEGAARLRREALAALGDWQGLAQACEAALRGGEGEAVLEADRADAVVWLALARARLGQADAAAEVARRYEGRLPEAGPWRPLLALAAARPLAGDPDGLVAGAKALAVEVRAQLDRLLPLGGGPAELRTEPARSAPPG